MLWETHCFVYRYASDLDLSYAGRKERLNPALYILVLDRCLYIRSWDWLKAIWHLYMDKTWLLRTMHQWELCRWVIEYSDDRSFISQGRNEVYGIRDQRPKKGWDQGSQPRIRDQSPRDRDQRVFHGLKDQASR